jgi:CheY-like chemotaxis protein
MSTTHILHVEDDPADAFLVRRAVSQAASSWTIACVTDGDQAMDYLSGRGKYADRDSYPFPRLVLLDLKLPSMHGFDLLAWVRAHLRLRNLPVVVLSGSANEADRFCAYHLGANSYFSKTPLYRGLAETIQGLLGDRQPPPLGFLAVPGTPASAAWPRHSSSHGAGQARL